MWFSGIISPMSILLINILGSFSVELSDQVTMDSVRFDISEKNVPIPNKQIYQKMLINSVDRNVRWAAHFFLHPEDCPPRKEWYGFKSIRAAPQVKELKDFQNDLSDLVLKVEFNQKSNQFLNYLKDDLENIEKEKKVYVPADKTSNMYLMDPANYKTLLEKNVQATYKKATNEDLDEVTINTRKLSTN